MSTEHLLRTHCLIVHRAFRKSLIQPTTDDDGLVKVGALTISKKRKTNKDSDSQGFPEGNMKKHAWSELNSLQIGKYAEYFVKMEFTQYGFDVYSSEVDDRGIDFVVRKEQPN